MSNTFADVAGYGYPEGVRPRSVLGRVVDACRALVQLLRGVAVMVVILAVFLAPSALEAGLDAWLNSLPPVPEEAAAVCGGGVTESAAVYDSGVTKGGAR